jgi:hypothetical protein
MEASEAEVLALAIWMGWEELERKCPDRRMEQSEGVAVAVCRNEDSNFQGCVCSIVACPRVEKYAADREATA